MVKLTFANGTPNTSMEVGDLVYYISNPVPVKQYNYSNEPNYFLAGTDELDDDGDGIYPISNPSSYVYIGVLGAITFDNEPEQLGQNLENDDGELVFVADEEVTQNTFTLWIDNTQDIIPPAKNDFIFFAKDNRSNVSSLLGYYNNIRFSNNSPRKAELFAVSCGYEESSK